jgi:type VI secretion system secreted protein VgrG
VNVEFAMPGKYEAKGGTHALLGGASAAAVLPALPMDLAKLKPNDMLLEYKHSDGSPVQGALYEVSFADGSKRTGALDAAGRAVLNAVPPGLAKVHYGEDARQAPEGKDETNPLAGWM